MWSTRGCLRATAYLLKISPRVTYLSLRRDWELPPPKKDAEEKICDWETNSANIDDDWETGLSSWGMFSHLKYVQIKRVECCDAELKLLSFLLKNAADLEEVSVYFRFSVGSPDKVTQVEQFKDKLTGVPKASSSIQLVFQTGCELD